MIFVEVPPKIGVRCPCNLMNVVVDANVKGLGSLANVLFLAFITLDEVYHSSALACKEAVCRLYWVASFRYFALDKVASVH